MAKKWKKVPGEHKHLYWVSNYGDVSDSDGNILKEYIEDGYKYVRLANESKYGYTRRRVHLLVLVAFLCRKNDKYVAKHIGDRGDNRLDNLEWRTPTGRTSKKRTYIKGRFDHVSRDEVILARSLYREHRSCYSVRDVIGGCLERNRTIALEYTRDMPERKVHRKHSKETKSRCIELYRQGRRSPYIERETGVRPQSIIQWAREAGLEIIDGRTEGYNLPLTTKLDPGKVRKIRKSYSEGVGPKSLGVQFGVDPKTIYKIIKRKTWKHVK